MGARLVAGADGRYVEVNEEALALLGRSRAEVLAARIGDFAGPHRELARTVWARLAAAGEPIPTGEASIHRPDGSAVRVRYTRISRRADGAYELELEPLGSGDGPPLVDKPGQILEEWRAAEREREADGADGQAQLTSDALRTLYQLGVRARSNGSAES